MLSRYLKTSEVVVSKLFPAGCGWQAASIVAENLNYLPSTMPFFLTVGLGEGLAVGVGHLTYYTIKKKLINNEINMKNEMGSALQLGTAATMSGTIWQPTVNALSNYDFIVASSGTFMICGLTFYTGLRLSRSLYGNLLPDGNKRNDLLLSVSVAGAAGMFVATDVSLANNFMMPYLGITDSMSDLHGVGLAGLSTATGFVFIQNFQNIFMKKNWID